MASFESNVAWRFAPGCKLVVQGADKSVTVGEDGDVKVSGLTEGHSYVLSDGQGRTIQFTAKSDETKATPALVRAEREGARLRELRSGGSQKNQPLPSAAPGFTTAPNVVTGARSAQDLRSRHQPLLTGQLDERTRTSEKDPDPGLNQLDVQGVPQRSDTPFGEATPADPKELQPYPSQDDVSGPQRSDTEHGMATPVSKGEVEPSVAQEDAPKNLKQASATPEGGITPVDAPKSKKGAVEAEKAKASSTRKTGVKKAADLKAEKTAAKVKSPRKPR